MQSRKILSLAVILTCLTLTLFALGTVNSARLAAGYSHSLSEMEMGPIEFTDSTHYYYGNTNYYDLDSVGVDVYYPNGAIDTDMTVYDTVITDSLGYQTIFSLPAGANASIRNTVMDANERIISCTLSYNPTQILYSVHYYYGSHAQPDSIYCYMENMFTSFPNAVNQEKWLFQYDNLGRKSRIDYYWLVNGSWVYEGYYTLAYTGQQFPVTLDLSRPETSISLVHKGAALFDANYAFSSISFHHLSGEVDDQGWQCNPATLTFSAEYPDSVDTYESYQIIYTFGTNGKLSYFSHLFSDGLMRYTYLNESRYYWTTGVPVHDPSRPAPVLLLSQNSPNPFTGSTDICYSLKQPGNTTVKVYNLKGQLITTLADAHHAKGDFRLSWDGRDSQGEAVPSGIYFLRLQQGSQSQTIKAVKLR